MTSAGGGGHVRSGRGASLVLALALAVVGVAALVWRPLAPAVGPVATDLDRLAPELARAIASYRAPRLVAPVSLEVLAVALPVALVVTARGRRLVDRVVGGGGRPLVRAAGIALVVGGAVRGAALPVQAWAGLVHDGAWQVRTASATAWWARVATSLGIDLAVLVVASVGLVVLARRRPGTWHLDLVGVGLAAVAALVLLWPAVLLPLTTPTVPLGSGPTADAVRRTVSDAGLGEVPVVVAQRSRRDVRVNAVVAGVGPTRRVVVDDNLLARPTDEVVAVMAHELAHQRHRDVERGVLGAAPGLLVLGLALRPAWSAARRRWWPDAGPGDPRFVAVALAVVAAAGPVVQPVALWQSRRVEAAADAGAHELGATPATTIRLQRRLAIDNLAPLERPGWQTLLFGSHPSGAERVRAAVARARRTDQPLPTREELHAAEAASPPAWRAPGQR